MKAKIRMPKGRPDMSKEIKWVKNEYMAHVGDSLLKVKRGKHGGHRFWVYTIKQSASGYRSSRKDAMSEAERLLSRPLEQSIDASTEVKICDSKEEDLVAKMKRLNLSDLEMSKVVDLVTGLVVKSRKINDVLEDIEKVEALLQVIEKGLLSYDKSGKKEIKRNVVSRLECNLSELRREVIQDKTDVWTLKEVKQCQHGG
jgi:hypothetical protein